MTLNTQRDKEPLHRHSNTPLPSSYNVYGGHSHAPIQRTLDRCPLTQNPAQRTLDQCPLTQNPAQSTLDQRPLTAQHTLDQRPLTQKASAQRGHAPLGQSSSYQLGDRPYKQQDPWLTDSDEDEQSVSDCLYRVVLLGDHGVGKSSLAGIFAGNTDKEEQSGGDRYKRTLTVDGEETTLVVMDTWEQDKLEDEGLMKIGSAYAIVYSITDRSSFDSASELRIKLRRLRQADNIPIILVGNKSDLVRSREVTVEEGRACAVVFDCKFIETSTPLQHNVSELFEGVVRQIRLRRETSQMCRQRRSCSRRKESLTKKARRLLDRLVARNNQHVALKVRSKSCHDLSVL